MPVLRSRIVRGVCPKCGARNQSFLADAMEERDIERSCLQCGKVSYFTHAGEARAPAVFQANKQGLPNERRKLPAPLPGISVRERDVMELVAEGRSNRAIASMLRISIGTVQIHVCRLYQELGAATRRELIDQAQGLVQSEP